MPRDAWRLELTGLALVGDATNRPGIVGFATRVLDRRRGITVSAQISLTDHNDFVVDDVRVYAARRPDRRATTTLVGADLRLVSLSNLLAQVAREITDAVADPARFVVDGYPEFVRDAFPVAPAARAQRSNSIPDGKLRQLAEAYLREQTAGPGLRRRIAKALQLPDDESSDRLVRYWTTRARQEGWLGSTEHGKRLAVAGPRLLEYRRQPGKKRSPLPAPKRAPARVEHPGIPSITADAQRRLSNRKGTR